MFGSKRIVRIRVTEGDKKKVNIAVPLGIARVARLGGVADQLSKQHGIDLEEFLTGIEESPDGKLIDVVDDKTGEHVEIYLETPEADAVSVHAEARG
jgi:hypothetical protein